MSIDMNTAFHALFEILDSEIANQKKKAHSAIDMQNWDEAQIVLNEANQTVSLINSWKSTLSSLINEIEESNIIKDDCYGNAKENIVTESTNNNTLNTDVEKLSQGNSSLTDENIYNEITSTKYDANFFQPTLLNTSMDEWYMLDCDFQNSKVKAILYDNKKYNVKDMTGALLLSCDLLYSYNNEIFNKMLKASFVHGSSQKYISDEPFDNNPHHETKYYKKMTKANIYVWVNLNSNQKANLISNMLQFFDMSTDTIKVACREDYAPMKREYHTKISVTKEILMPDWSDDLIDDNVYSKPSVSNYNTGNVVYTNISNVESEILTELDEKDIISLCEEMILCNPYRMAIINIDSNICNIFSYDEYNAKRTMSNPKMLSNGLWVETTNISKSNIADIKSFCRCKI